MLGGTDDVQVSEPLPSFAAFYPGVHDRVFRALALTLHDPDLAADAVHEALARAYARWPQVAAYDNPTGWVYRVALNWARSRFRRTAREILSAGPSPAGGAEMPEPADPELEAALQRLPVDQRAVVVLRLWLDWSVADVATALDIPPGTVKSRLSRALDRLRIELEG